MRSRDLVMIVVSFLAMLAGSFLPGLAEPLAPFPRLCLIVLHLRMTEKFACSV